MRGHIRSNLSRSIRRSYGLKCRNFASQLFSQPHEDRFLIIGKRGKNNQEN